MPVKLSYRCCFIRRGVYVLKILRTRPAPAPAPSSCPALTPTSLGSRPRPRPTPTHPLPPSRPSCPVAAESGACSAVRGRRGAGALLGPDRSGPHSSLVLRLGSGCQRPSSPRPARTRRAPCAGPSTSAFRDRTDAADSTAGCESDPGDEMTTSTLQVLGAARLA